MLPILSYVDEAIKETFNHVHANVPFGTIKLALYGNT